MSAMTERLAGSISSYLPLSSAAATTPADAPARTQPHRPGRPHVIDAPLFRDALVKERKRAERFDQAFMVVLVAPRAGIRAETSHWHSVTTAVRTVATDTDVVGWYQNRAALGVIIPEIGTAVAEQRAAYKKVRRDVLTRLKAGRLADDFSVRVHLHPGANAAAAPDTAIADLPGGTEGTPVREALKRALDIAGSLLLLTALAPVYAVVAALVKLTSPGPVFFRQERIGTMGRPFRMLKFRTMYVNNDSSIHQKYVSEFIKSGGGSTPPAGASIFKIVNDPRITPIGHVLRKTSLDELPQFWNVLKGEMSLVGPRPPLAYEVAQYKPWHYRRVLEAKPGVTGLWQVTGLSRTTFDEMVRLDLRYARSYSVWTDVKILLATPRAVISGKGAC